MGSTKISGLAAMFVQEQTKAVGQTEPKTKTSDLTNRFQEYMQQMTTRVTGELVSGQGQSADTVMKSVSVKTNGSESTNSKTTDYESNYRRTEVKSLSDDGKELNRQDVTQELDAYEEKVREVLKEKFGVTDEEITDVMETLGFTALDLMDPSRLAELAAKLTGAEEAGDMLFDAGFQQLMQETDTLTKELLQELGISKEELTALCEKAIQTVPEETQSPVQTQDILPQNNSFAEQMVAETNPTADSSGLEEQPEFTAALTEGTNQPKDSASDAAGKDEKVVKAAEESHTEQATIVREPETKEAKTEEAVPVIKEETTEEVPQKENFSGNGQTLAQNQDTAKGQGEQTAQIVHHVEVTEVPVTEAVPEQTGYSSQVDVANIIREIVEFARVHVTEQTTTLQMQLNPEHLGKVMLELTAKEGAVSARIFAQNEMVREALEAQMVELRQNMNQAGIKVEAIEVTVESHEFERNLEQQANQERQQAEEQEKAARQTRKINLMDTDNLDALTGMMSEEEALVAQIMADRGNSVDFTA